MLNSTRILGAALIVLAAGCASSGASGAPAATAAGSAAQQSRGTQRSSRDLITADELGDPIDASGELRTGAISGASTSSAPRC